MSVGSLGVAISYISDGTTVNFNYPDYLYDSAHIVVWVTPVGSNQVAYVLNGAGATGFTFLGNLDPRAAAGATGPFPNGGTVTLNQPALAGALILIQRITPKTQLTVFIDNDPFPSVALEWSLDKLDLIAQEQTMFLGLSNGYPPQPGTVDGQWYQQSPQELGQPFGYVWVAASNTWSPFGAVSL